MTLHKQSPCDEFKSFHNAMAEITKDTFGLHDLIISSTGKWKKDVELAGTFLQHYYLYNVTMFNS